MALPAPRDPQPLPATRSRALVVLWNPDATPEHFSRVVESDAALTAAVLRAANSASSAPLAPIATPREAIIRLGLDLARKLTSGVIVRSEFEGLEHSRLSINELWRHLRATALIAEASCTIPEQRGVLFTAGLLHDVGRLSLATQNPVRYAQVVLAARQGADVSDAERQTYGTTHTAVGARLGEVWRLPEPVIEAAAGHHTATAGGPAMLVLQARDLACRLGYGDGVTDPPPYDFEPDDPDAAVIADLGGPDGLAARIEWYRESLAA